MTVWGGYLSAASTFFSVFILHSKAYSITSEATLLEYFKALRANATGTIALPAAGPAYQYSNNYILTRLWVQGTSTSVDASLSESKVSSGAITSVAVISSNTFKTTTSDSYFYTYDII